MSTNVIVLGGGRVGGAIARDLAREADYAVTIADLDPRTANKFAGDDRIRCVRADLTSGSAIGRCVAGQDLVVGALPGHLGFAAAQHVIEQGKHLVDISFFAEDPFRLDDLAKQHGATVVVDCGVAPGLSNLVLGRVTATWDEVASFECYVGGLPQDRKPPWEYQAPFSPIDVIEEYTRPARIVINGESVLRPALSDLELIDFEGVGPLEAFNTDGLRTLIATMTVPNMKEKTLRYPGHVEKIAALRDAGMFGTDPVHVGDAIVRPIDVTSQLLFQQWFQADGDRDITVMRIVIEGTENGHSVRDQYDMLDHYDDATRTTSMARTTGYTCAAVARLVGTGAYRRPGVSPPEFVGKEESCYRFVMAALEERGVVLRVTRWELEQRPRAGERSDGP